MHGTAGVPRFIRPPAVKHEGKGYQALEVYIQELFIFCSILLQVCVGKFLCVTEITCTFKAFCKVFGI